MKTSERVAFFCSIWAPIITYPHHRALGTQGASRPLLPIGALCCSSWSKKSGSEFICTDSSFQCCCQAGFLIHYGLLMWHSGREPTANAGDPRDTGSVPGSRRYPGVGNGNPLKYSCLGNCIDRGAWRAVVHGVAVTEWLSTKYVEILSVTRKLGQVI